MGQITKLRDQLKASEHDHERLTGDLELKNFLLKEEEAVAAETKAKLEKAQQVWSEFAN